MKPAGSRPSVVSLAAMLWSAIGLLAVLPLVLILWTVDELDRRRWSVDVQGRPESPGRVFAPENTLVASSSTTRGPAALPMASDAAVTPTLPTPKASLPALGALGGSSIHAELLSSSLAPSALMTPLPGSIWQAPELQLALAVYLIGLGVAVGLAVMALRSVGRFGNVAWEIAFNRSGSQPMPAELVRPTRAIEQLILELRQFAEQLRHDSRDMVHSMRTPLGTIMGCVDALRREVPPGNARALRAVQFIAISTQRLSAMTDASLRSNRELADLLVAPRLRLDLGGLVREAVERHVGVAAIAYRLDCQFEDGVVVRAPAGVLEAAVDALLLLVRSAASPGSTMTVAATADGKLARLDVGRGQGLRTAEEIERSMPADDAGSEQLQGACDSIRRSITLLGGGLECHVNESGDWSIMISLPRDGA